jgi:site-specific DNA-methyltransferase (adenine-specific)
MIELLLGDCLERLRDLPDCSVDACVTDPPYGLSFMGKAWDYDVPTVEVWREVLRVLKPGGHLLAFAGTRTQHRMAVQIEDAGFEIRDLIAWVYGSGFPKSLDVSKAIDKAAGAEREVVGSRVADDIRGGNMHAANRGERHVINITAPATPAAQQWSGWGTALKPALEPITVARKPFKGTVAANVLEHGTGAINVDGCRVAHAEPCRMMQPSQANIDNPSDKCRQAGRREAVLELKPEGRWPANLIHDGSDEPCALLGSAARFFYCAKASKADRGEGNVHPTVKPTELMRYLCRLVTPPGGVVLDPFMGSGSTGKAAVLEGFRFIGIEREAEYLEIARGRIEVPAQGSLL